MMSVHDLINIISDKTRVGLIVEHGSMPFKLSIYVPEEACEILRYELSLVMSAFIFWTIHPLGPAESYLKDIEHLRV